MIEAVGCPPQTHCRISTILIPLESTEEVSEESSVQFKDTDIHLKKVPGKLPEIKEQKCDSSLDPQGECGLYISSKDEDRNGSIFQGRCT